MRWGRTGHMIKPGDNQKADIDEKKPQIDGRRKRRQNEQCRKVKIKVDFRTVYRDEKRAFCREIAFSEGST